jgi:hypothetical protein
VEKGAEAAGRLAGAGFENASEVALVGKSRIACDKCQIGPSVGQRAASKLNSQVIHKFGHGAAVPLPKDTRQVNWVYTHLEGNLFQG